MKITKNELIRLTKLGEETMPLGFNKRKGRFFMRDRVDIKLNFDEICKRIDYLEKRMGKEESVFMKFRYYMAQKILIDALEVGNYEK